MEDATVGKMEIDDIPQVVEVGEILLSDTLVNQTFSIRKNYREPVFSFLRMEYGEKIIGYVGMWIVIDDAQITTIAISPEYRRKKLGEKLFGFSLQTALAMGAKVLSLEVRVSNIPAQKLYRKFGLMPGGIRKNYYTDNDEDAIVMWVNLS